MTHGPLSWRELVERDKQKSEDARGQIKRAAMHVQADPVPNRWPEAALEDWDGVMTKGTDMNQIETVAHEAWAAAQLAPGEGILDGVERITAILAAMPVQAEPVAELRAEITSLTEALRAAEEREKALREALDCLPKHLTRTRGAKPC